MRRLMLMRHATATGAAVGGDAERPLTPRGVEEATKIGRYLAGRGWLPDLALCSTARRVAETWAAVAAALGAEIPSRREDALYLASAAGLGAALARVEAEFGAVILINHNPAIGEFAHALAERCPGGPAAASLFEFPTAALAVFEVDAPGWTGLETAPIALRAVVAPDNL